MLVLRGVLNGQNGPHKVPQRRGRPFCHPSLCPLLTMPTMTGYQQQAVTAKLNAIQVDGLRERHFDRHVDTFVTVAVDGEQQFQTEVVPQCLQPKWTFKEHINLTVYPSSSIKFTVYRRRGTFVALGDKYLGEVEKKLLEFVTHNNKMIPLNTSLCHLGNVKGETGNISIDLTIDTSILETPKESLLDHASENLLDAERTANMAHELGKHAAGAASLLGQAIGSLDQIVNIVDGIVEIHPLCKVAWTLLSSVYKALKHQHEQDGAIKALAIELRDTLAHAKECRDVKAIPGARDVIRELAQLVVEGAALMDESMKYTMLLRTAKSAISPHINHRIKDCQANLKSLRTSLQFTLMIRLYQGQSALVEGMLQRNTSVASSCSCSEKLSKSPEMANIVQLVLKNRHNPGTPPGSHAIPEDDPRVASPAVDRLSTSPPGSPPSFPSSPPIGMYRSLPQSPRLYFEDRLYSSPEPLSHSLPACPVAGRPDSQVKDGSRSAVYATSPKPFSPPSLPSLSLPSSEDDSEEDRISISSALTASSLCSFVGSMPSPIAFNSCGEPVQGVCDGYVGGFHHRTLSMGYEEQEAWKPHAMLWTQ